MRAKQLWRFPLHPLAMVFSARLAFAARRIARSAPARLLIAGLAGGAAASLGGCAQQPPVQRAASAHSKEYFPSSIYGQASPRVVAYGEPVPRGGGTYMVGKPYSVAGHTYYPSAKQYAAVGQASWYGDAFHGRRTANGEVYDIDSISAAHPTMPLPSYARVTNLRNKYSMIVRVNDRGPFDSSRIMDVSRKTAEVLDFRGTGTAKVKVEYLGPAGLEGSDDQQLMATLRTDGPAKMDSRPGQGGVMVAEGAPLQTAEAAPTGDSRDEAAASVPVPVSRPFAGIASSSPAGTAPLPPARPGYLGTNSAARSQIATRTRQANLR